MFSTETPCTHTELSKENLFETFQDVSASEKSEKDLSDEDPKYQWSRSSDSSDNTGRSSLDLSVGEHAFSTIKKNHEKSKYRGNNFLFFFFFRKN